LVCHLLVGAWICDWRAVGWTAESVSAEAGGRALVVVVTLEFAHPATAIGLTTVGSRSPDTQATDVANGWGIGEPSAAQAVSTDVSHLDRCDYTALSHFVA